jgi:hypothetical protein
VEQQLHGRPNADMTATEFWEAQAAAIRDRGEIGA